MVALSKITSLLFLLLIVGITKVHIDTLQLIIIPIPDLRFWSFMLGSKVTHLAEDWLVTVRVLHLHLLARLLLLPSRFPALAVMESMLNPPPPRSRTLFMSVGCLDSS